MSQATEKALTEALAAHFADEQPGYIATHWVGIVAGVGEEDGLSGYLKFSSDMPHWQHIGLARTLSLEVETDYLAADNEGDEGDV
jgi:hypothetical protein